jgi:hypothetical protein
LRSESPYVLITKNPRAVGGDSFYYHHGANLLVDGSGSPDPIQLLQFHHDTGRSPSARVHPRPGHSVPVPPRHLACRAGHVLRPPCSQRRGCGRITTTTRAADSVACRARRRRPHGRVRVRDDAIPRPGRGLARPARIGRVDATIRRIGALVHDRRRAEPADDAQSHAPAAGVETRALRILRPS